MKNFTKLTSCICILLLGVGCGFDPYKKSIEGSALTPLSETDKKELVKYGDRPITELEPADKKAVADIIDKQLGDTKKLAKQMCHLDAVNLSKPECLENIKKCQENKADDAGIAQLKSIFLALPISPELLSKSIEKLANFLGSAELVNMQCGDNPQNLMPQLKNQLKELGLAPEIVDLLSGSGDSAPSETQVLLFLKVGLESKLDNIVEQYKAEKDETALRNFKTLSSDQLKTTQEYQHNLKTIMQGLTRQGLTIAEEKIEPLLLDFFKKIQDRL